MEDDYGDSDALAYHSHFSTDSTSTISTSTNATASNLTGAGRTVGRLFDGLGARLEHAVNTGTQRHDQATYTGEANENKFQRASEASPSDSTNATAPNLTGAGRTVGLLFDRLGAILENAMNTSAKRYGLGPSSVAHEVRILLRHEEISISDRHSGFAAWFTDKDEKKLKKLCKRLLKYARHRIRENQFQALEEIIQLTVEDPLARIALAAEHKHHLTPKFKEPDLILATSRAFGSIEFSDVHELWSGALSGRLFEYSRKLPISFHHITVSGFDTLGIEQAFVLANESMETTLEEYDEDFNLEVENHIRSLAQNKVCSSFRSLLRSLSNAKSSFLAARYLKEYILHLNHTQSNRTFQDQEAEFVLWLWEQYCEVAYRSPLAIEWTNLDKLASVSDIRFEKSNDGSHPLPQLAPLLIREAEDMQDTLFTHFAIANLFAANGSCKDQYMICSLTLDFLQNLTKSRLLADHITYIHNMATRTRRLLKDTILVSEVAVAYCHLWISAWMFLTYGQLERHMGPPDTGSLEYGSKILASHLKSAFNSSNYEQDTQLVINLSRRCFSMHRYSRTAIVKAITDSVDIAIDATFARLGSRMENDPCYATPYCPIFENIQGGDLLLVRFQIEIDGKRCLLTSSGFGGFITSSHISLNWCDLRGFESQLRRKLAALDILRQGTNILVQTMLISPDSVMTITVDHEETFNSTGHYPVLGGYDSAGESLYIALDSGNQLGPKIFSYVKNKASHMEVTNNNDDIEIRRIFRVLVLRHNPLDLHAESSDDSRSIPQGVADPTGPVGWLPYSPEIYPKTSNASAPEYSEFDEFLELTLDAIEAEVALVERDLGALQVQAPIPDSESTRELALRQTTMAASTSQSAGARDFEDSLGPAVAVERAAQAGVEEI